MILFLKEHPSEPYHDSILDACLHHPAYDRQSEGTRGAYMLDLMRASGHFQVYRQHVLDALRASVEAEDPDEYDDDHLCSIARWLAEAGDQEARDALYTFVTAALENGEDKGAKYLITLDGIEGFVHVVTAVDRQEGAAIDADSLYGGWLTYVLQEREGEEQANALIAEAAAQNERVAAYQQAVAWNDARTKRNKAERAERPYEDYAVLQALIENSTRPKYPGKFLRWGRQANDDDLARAATDLIEAQDKERILKYLHVFRRRAFPLDHAHLIALTEHEDEAIVEAAYSALEMVPHPAVRAHALHLFANARRPAEAVGLLAANFEEGDQPWIEQVLHQVLTDDEVHAIGRNVLDIMEQRDDENGIVGRTLSIRNDHRTQEQDAPLLLRLYEREPCSFCREYIVEALIALDCMPSWMLAECRYDSYMTTRTLIEEAYVDDDHLPEHREL